MVIALAVTVVFHASLIVFGSFNGLTYIYPPPPEQSFVIDFSEDNEKQVVRQQKKGSAPQVEEPDRTKPINIVQRSEAQEIGKKENLAQEATVDDYGDVEKYEPPREKPIDRRALFHAANNKSDKDTLAPQTAAKVTEALKEGHAQGNTKTGKTVGTQNAHVKGRSLVGVIAKPDYPVNKEGTVVVTIWVNKSPARSAGNHDGGRHPVERGEESGNEDAFQYGCRCPRTPERHHNIHFQVQHRQMKAIGASLIHIIL